PRRVSPARVRVHRRRGLGPARAGDGRKAAMSRARSEWLAERHSLGVEAALVVGLYAVYETSRGLVAGGSGVALHHARMGASLERSLHVFVEADGQHAARGLPGPIRSLAPPYLALHLAV